MQLLLYLGGLLVNMRISLLLALLLHHKSAIFHQLIRGLLILRLPTANKHLLLHLLPLLLYLMSCVS